MRFLVLPGAVLLGFLSGLSFAHAGNPGWDAACNKVGGSSSGSYCKMPTGQSCSAEGLVSAGACFHDGIWEKLEDLEDLTLSEAEETEEDAEATSGDDESTESDAPADTTDGSESSGDDSAE